MDSYKRAKAITPHDTNTFPRSKAIYVATTGTIICLINGIDVTITAVAGHIVPIQTTRIKAASTATGIIALS